MLRIYKGQSALRISLETAVNLERINGAYIKYKKPDKSTGSWTAGVSDALRGVIFRECIEGDIPVSGWWTFWAFVEFDDGRTAAGEPVKIYIWNEGQ